MMGSGTDVMPSVGGMESVSSPHARADCSPYGWNSCRPDDSPDVIFASTGGLVMSYAGRLAGAAGAAAIALSQPLYSQSHPYRTIENHFKLPEGRKIGSTAGITIDRDGSSVWVFERCGGQNCVGSNLAPILKFDASGKLVQSFGAGIFVRPHGIHIDRDGNVWVTDGEGPD